MFSKSEYVKNHVSYRVSLKNVSYNWFLWNMLIWRSVVAKSKQKN